MFISRKPDTRVKGLKHVGTEVIGQLETYIQAEGGNMMMFLIDAVKKKGGSVANDLCSAQNDRGSGIYFHSLVVRNDNYLR